MDQILNNNTSTNYPMLEDYYKRLGPRTQQVSTAQNILISQTMSGKMEPQVQISQQNPTQIPQLQRLVHGFEKNFVDNNYERNIVDKQNYPDKLNYQRDNNFEDQKPTSAERHAQISNLPIDINNYLIINRYRKAQTYDRGYSADNE